MYHILRSMHGWLGSSFKQFDFYYSGVFQKRKNCNMLKIVQEGTYNFSFHSVYLRSILLQDLKNTFVAIYLLHCCIIIFSSTLAVLLHIFSLKMWLVFMLIRHMFCRRNLPSAIFHMLCILNYFIISKKQLGLKSKLER